MDILSVPISSLQPDPANARAHDERNLAAIAASLARFEQVEPLVVQKSSRRVIGGNGRLAAMKSLGWTEARIVEVDVDDMTATALAIALNRTAELAEWDDAVLGRLLAELREAGEADVTGFDDSEIDALLTELADAEIDELEDPGEMEPPTIAVAQPGDLFILGDHRLLCGDSTKPEDLARLMDGKVAHLLATDPPYLVDYDGTNHPADHHRKAGRVPGEGKELGNKHWDSYVDPESSIAFFRDYLAACLSHISAEAPIYQWHASRRQSLVEAAWGELDLLVHQTIVWVKSRGVLTRSHFLWKSEPCFYGWQRGNQPERDRRPPPSTTNVWEIDQAGENDGIHPTQKPRTIFGWPIEWHTRRGEIVLEPFSGSGTQIIAAEERGRRCFAMEQAPEFVDAAIMRFEKATGKKATREDGVLFQDLQAQKAKEVTKC